MYIGSLSAALLRKASRNWSWRKSADEYGTHGEWWKQKSLFYYSFNHRLLFFFLLSSCVAFKLKSALSNVCVCLWSSSPHFVSAFCAGKKSKFLIYIRLLKKSEAFFGYKSLALIHRQPSEKQLNAIISCMSVARFIYLWLLLMLMLIGLVSRHVDNSMSNYCSFFSVACLSWNQKRAGGNRGSCQVEAHGRQ